MRLLDLFCGRWGWSRAFAARGWHCVGVDLTPPPEVPENCEWWQADVLSMSIRNGWLRWSKLYDLGFNRTVALSDFDFIVASSPCEEFSTMRNFRPPVPYPELGIRLFNHTRSICEASGLPYVMENVAGAQRYVGQSVAHAGSFHLWGNAVPPLLHQGLRKGMTELAMGLREHKGKPGWDVRHGVKGQTQTALVATIPPDLANCVADYAERLLEQKAVSA